MLKSKIIHLKETYKFCFDHFLEKRTVFILIKKTLLKIKSCGSGQTIEDTVTSQKRKYCLFIERSSF